MKIEQFKPKVIWFTGLSGSGKTTLAKELGKILTKNNVLYYILDGDIVRTGLNKDLGYSDKDRQENIRRVGEIAKILYSAGLVTITAFISPFEADRTNARNLIPERDFIEVYLDCPIDICEERDVKGLYKKAREGEIEQFTGIDSRYEVPSNPEIILNTHILTPEQCVERLINIWHTLYS